MAVKTLQKSDKSYILYAMKYSCYLIFGKSAIF